MILKTSPPCDRKHGERDGETMAVFIVKLNTVLKMSPFISYQMHVQRRLALGGLSICSVGPIK